MNVIVSNNQQSELSKLDLDVIKSINGSYDAAVLVEMFRTFFFNKMVLDVTAIKNFEDIQNYKTLINGLDAEKIIFFLPENTQICTATFLAKLIELGIYNFTTNVEGIKYLIKHSNTYSEVEHIVKLAERKNIPAFQAAQPTQQEYEIDNSPIPEKRVGSLIIGVKNVTKSAGATTFIYMLKKELEYVLGDNSVLAIEIDKNDFNVFNDKKMISSTKDDIRNLIQKSTNFPIILIDLNDFPDESICSDIYYLLEPSIIKLNKLIRRNNSIFESLKGRKIILNKSLLTEKDISDFEYEAKTKVFYNMPPLDDRKNNSVMINFLIKVGLIRGDKRENPNNKVFGLFRR